MNTLWELHEKFQSHKIKKMVKSNDPNMAKEVDRYFRENPDQNPDVFHGHLNSNPPFVGDTLYVATLHH